MIKRTLPLLALGIGLLIPAHAARAAENSKDAAKALEQGFADPAPEFGPRTWWHWINELVTKDGITKDLEAMKRLGYRGAHIVNLPSGGSKAAHGDDVVGTPQWMEKVEFTTKEAERLGLELSIGSCPGWVAGGPWITPELSMQDIVWRDLHVQGPNSGPIQLPQPQTNKGFYKDIAVLAFPTLPGDATPLASYKPVVTSSVPGIDWAAAIDGNPETFVNLPPWKKDEKNRQVIFEFKEPVPVRSIHLQMQEDSERHAVKLSVGDNGTDWKPLGTAGRWRKHFLPSREERIEGFQEQTARFVKLDFEPPKPEVGMKLYEVNFQSARLDSLHTKAARQRTQPSISDPSTQTIPGDQSIKLGQILDLTDKLQPDGTLDCRLPEGQWTIVRFGHTTNGNKIHPASERSEGLETDKMSAEATKFHLDKGLLGPTLKSLGDLVGKVMVEANIDSWEANCQTWTSKFPEEFQKRIGYDMRKWLPALTGRIVEDVDQTERFLWDYRRTIGDLIAKNFYGTFREYVNGWGMKLSAEAPGIGIPIQSDQLQILGQLDIPQGEFWLGPKKDPKFPQWPGGQNNTKEAAAAGHIYGKNVISCESFTSFGHHDGFTQYPFILKPVSDRQFCNGMNEIVFHCYAHQPDDRMPAMTLGQFGLHMQRSNTWWEQARDWITSLRRSQFMLRQGRFFADVCYYYGEDVPGSAYFFTPGSMDPRKKMLPVLPQGYDYDVCNREILDRMSVEDGLVSLPSGMRYAYLVLPDHARYTPAALEKIFELVNAGATVIGPRPTRSPSLKDLPNSDQKIQELAAKMWPDAPGERRVGKGRVITGMTFEQILAKDGLVPDFEAVLPGQKNPKEKKKIADDFAPSKKQIRYIHRKLADGDLYFIASQSEQPEEATLRFRVSGKVPEVWNPVTGERSTVTHYKDDGKVTTIPLQLDPYGSRFLVFRTPSDNAASKPIAKLTKDNAPVLLDGDGHDFTVWENGNYAAEFQDGRKAQVQVCDIPAAETVPSGWTVTFQKDRGAPEGQIAFDDLVSWTARPEEGIKYFSGTATYEKGINISQERLKNGQRVYLDLGDVKHLAEVSVNDKPLGVLWKPPFQLDITDAAKPGANKVTVKVTNVWKNRLIKDATLPEDSRVTWVFYPFYRNDPAATLMESGLLGPVRVLNSEKIRLDQ
jgi:hypothetical protein